MKIRRNCLSVGVVVLGLALAGAVVNCAGEVWAAASTLTLSIDDATVDMNIAPLNGNGSFNKSSASTISASTNNATGYTLTISAPDNAGSNYDKLVNTDNIACDNAGSNTNSNSGNISTNCLNSLKIATPEAQFKALNGTGYNGLWGYLPSKYNSSANTDFLPAPTITGDVIDKTTTANTVANTYTVAVGARVDSTMKTGSYSNTFVVKLVAEAVPYSIIYDDNVVSNMPMDVDSTTPDNTVSVASNTPTRSGYKFLGWCTVIPTNTAGVDACTGGTQYQPNATLSIDHVTTSNNNYHLYAMWQELIMQAFSASDCSAMSVGDTMVAKDARDGKLYWVTKLEDGHCWMTQNLALNLSSSTPLTSETTDLKEVGSNGYTTDYTCTGGTGTGCTGGVISWTPAETANTIVGISNLNATSWPNSDVYPYSYNHGDTAVSDGNGSADRHRLNGIYYNWSAAIASSDSTNISTATYDHPENNPKNSICPKGWRLPTISNNTLYPGTVAGSSNEFRRLNVLYNSNLTNSATGLMNAPLYFARSGHVKGGSLDSAGSDGGYWSSTVLSGTFASGLNFNSGRVSPEGNGNRYFGFSVRCVAREQ